MSKVIEIDGIKVRVGDGLGKGTMRKRVEMVRLWKQQDGICPLCENAIDLTCAFGSDLSPTLDHIVPRSLGGKWKNNLRLVHKFCNELRSHGDDPYAFRRWMNRSLTQKQVAKKKAGRRMILGMKTL